MMRITLVSSLLCLVASADTPDRRVPAPYAYAIADGDWTKALAVLPDQMRTPGKVREGATAVELCMDGFTTKAFRHTTPAMKRAVYLRYNTSPNAGLCKSGCEVDHLVPLTLGGDDVIENLWPQPSEPKPGFHQKDALEVRLHSRVCHGLMTLGEAQQCITSNWYECWKTYVRQ